MVAPLNGAYAGDIDVSIEFDILHDVLHFSLLMKIRDENKVCVIIEKQMTGK